MKKNPDTFSSTAFIGLGSNAEQAAGKLAGAVESLASCVQVLDVSSVYYTEPQDYKPQPWFYNQVVKINPGAITPEMLMQILLELETRAGRARTGPRFGPRTIDMDLLLFGRLHSDNPFCRIPHPRLTQRAFVLVPLQELAPDLLINGRTPAQWLGELNWRKEGYKLYQP